MKLSLPPSLILLILLYAAPQAFGTDEPVPCANKSIVASAVRTLGDIQAFVQCAYELSRKWVLRRPAGPSTRTSVGEAAQPMSSSSN